MVFTVSPEGELCHPSDDPLPLRGRFRPSLPRFVNGRFRLTAVYASRLRRPPWSLDLRSLPAPIPTIGLGLPRHLHSSLIYYGTRRLDSLEIALDVAPRGYLVPPRMERVHCGAMMTQNVDSVLIRLAEIALTPTFPGRRSSASAAAAAVADAPRYDPESSGRTAFGVDLLRHAYYSPRPCATSRAWTSCYRYALVAFYAATTPRVATDRRGSTSTEEHRARIDEALRRPVLHSGPGRPSDPALTALWIRPMWTVPVAAQTSCAFVTRVGAAQHPDWFP